MRQDVSDNANVTTLFRQSAIEPAAHRLVGSVTVVLPPSAIVTLAIGLLSFLLLAFAAWYVEIPQRVPAIGVLMPPDGLRDIVADAPGRIGRITVEEGQYLEAGDLLLEIVSDREALARFQLRSLQAQASLLDQAGALEAAVGRNRIGTLDEQLDSLGERLTVAKTERDLQRQQIELFEKRMARRRAVAGNGGLSPDELDEQQGLLLQARTRLAAIRHSILDYEQQIAALSRSRKEARTESERRAILQDIERRRLDRLVLEQEHFVSHEIRASESGIVARINVHSGETVRAGEPLLKFYRPYEALEAWLYVSSSQAGLLAPHQVVELRLDAYPYEMFGTLRAVVMSSSRVAVVPREVKAPLALTGPVFEIRARLDRTAVDKFDAGAVLAPGASFRADLVKDRYRLYEWLLRHIVKGSRNARA